MLSFFLTANGDTISNYIRYKIGNDLTFAASTNEVQCLDIF